MIKEGSSFYTKMVLYQKWFYINTLAVGEGEF